MEDDYLVIGLNQLARYPSRSLGFSDAEIFCTTMVRLLEDRPRLEKIHQAINLRPETSDTLREHVSSVDGERFTDLVWKLSQRDPHVLMAAGVEPFLATRLISDVDRLIDLLTTPRDVGFDELRGRVSEVADDVCRLRQKPGLTAKRYSSLLKILGGGTIVVTNGTGDVLLGGALSLLSQSAGGGLFWDGLKGWPRE
jgi:hypothetical protein